MFRVEPLRRKFLHLTAGAAALSLLPCAALAQAYPTRPVSIIVPYAAGGPTDTIARLLAERMRATLGQPVLVENVTGANGTIAVGRVARAAPDGYTLSIGQTSTHVLNGASYALPYHVMNDFAPIALLTDSPLLIAGKRSLPADDLAGLIAWLKANPGKATAGIAGVAGLGQVSFVLFQELTGTRFQLVPYRGSAPAVQDLVAEQIDLAIPDLITGLPQVRGGTIKAYAVAGATRLPAAPEIPTVAEVGLPRLSVSFWHGLWAPKGTPKEIIAKLNGAVVSTLADPAIRSRLADLGQVFFPPERETPEALAAHQKAEIEKWWPVMKAAGVKSE
jgi:tripartite-type tricarboxylate transporter receptor subunit TctC